MDLFGGVAMYDEHYTIEGFDDELWRAMEDERHRQENHLELIASENYVSPRVFKHKDQF